MNEFSVEHKLSLADYKNLQLRLTYSKLWMIIVSAFSVIYLLAALIMLCVSSLSLFGTDWFSIGIIFCLSSLYPLLHIFLFPQLGYKQNKLLQENTISCFSEEGVTITGETHNFQFTWEKLYSVRLIGKWLLLYQSKLGANVVKLRDEDFSKVEELKKFLSTQNFKVKIKI